MTLDELSRYYYIKSEIKKINDRLEELDSTVIKASKMSDVKVDSSHNNNPLETLVIKKMQLQDKLHKEQEELFTEETKINDFIATINDLSVRLIIRLRFIEGLSWDKIAKELYCDRTTPYYKLKKYLESNNV